MHDGVFVIGSDPDDMMRNYNQDTDQVDKELLEFCNDGYEEDVRVAEKEFETIKLKAIKFPDGKTLFPLDAFDQDKKLKSEYYKAVKKKGDISCDKMALPKGYKRISIPAPELYDSWEDYAKDYKSLPYDEKEGFGYWNNPDGNWDWYSIGGRWKGTIILKKGGKKVDDAVNKYIDWDKTLDTLKKEGIGEVQLLTSDGWMGGYSIEELRKFFKELPKDEQVTIIDYHS